MNTNRDITKQKNFNQKGTDGRPNVWTTDVRPDGKVNRYVSPHYRGSTIISYSLQQISLNIKDDLPVRFLQYAFTHFLVDKHPHSFDIYITFTFWLLYFITEDI